MGAQLQSVCGRCEGAYGWFLGPPAAYQAFFKCLKLEIVLITIRRPTNAAAVLDTCWTRKGVHT